MRLDRYVFEHGFAQSRNKASELIAEGSVWVNGHVEKKSAYEVVANDCVEVSKLHAYVSRAGLKLRGFLNEYRMIEAQDQEVLDIGSSTGGFVQVWLEEGARSITAVDVGSEQLHVSLREDERILVYENTDIRTFTPEKTYGIVSCDVSFISLTTIMESIDRLARDWIILLFKPQFEVGKEVKRSSKGVVKDSSAIIRAQHRFEAHALSFGWTLVSKCDSTLQGKEGNVETFYCFKKR